MAKVLPQIRTQRTVVRLAERADLDTVLNFYSVNKERLTPLSPTWPQDFFTRSFWQGQIERNKDEFFGDASARLFIFLRQADKPVCIGNISLSAILRGAAQFCYLGYNIDARHEGQGLMQEAAAAVIEYAFDELRLHRIMANYMPTNERSGKLLRRLGFHVDGYARDYLLLNGKWEDHVMCSLINPRWRP